VGPDPCRTPAGRHVRPFIALSMAVAGTLVACQAALPSPAPSVSAPAASPPALQPTVDASIEGVYATRTSRAELAASPLAGTAAIDDASWGDSQLTFAAGKVAYVHGNFFASSSSSGQYSVAGDTVWFAFSAGAKSGQTFTLRWTVKGDALTLSPGATVTPAAVPLLVKPWQRVGSSTPPLVTLSSAVAMESADKVVFYRSGWQDDQPPQPYMVDAGGSHEVTLAERSAAPGVWSVGHQQVAFVRAVNVGPAASTDDIWARPAVMTADASRTRLLDAEKGAFNLVPLGWSPDGSRLFVYSGFDARDPSNMGTFTIRSSDGGDLVEVLPAPNDVLERPDFVHVSPDGARLLVNRQEKGKDPNVFVVDLSTLTWQKVNRNGTTSCEFPVSGLTEGGGQIGAEAWSPDGSAVALCAFVTADDGSALYVARGDGTGIRQIVPPSVGAVSVQWSPDGTMIAFTSRWRSEPQVWVVGADGSGLKQLTYASDGSTSVGPMWSPDGTRLLFERLSAGSATLWTMKADGSDAKQLSPTRLGSDYVGPWAWWSAAAQ
jgi:dipeptidyl aminopeptidase/acylaminoacyl peptidase